MAIGRRDAITIMMLGAIGASTEARAGEAHEIHQSGLLEIGFGIWTLWKSLPEGAKQDIWDALKATAKTVGRAVHSLVDNPGTSGAPRGMVARINIKIVKHERGHLVIDSHLADLDGDGKPEVVHSSTALHHRHPDMQAHFAHIVTRSDAWLRQHRM